MKILRIIAQDIPTFSEQIDISFYGKQRVSEDSKKHMYQLSPKIFLNCTIAFIGRNASGKTSVLQIISLALNILNNEPINHVKSKSILKNAQNATFYIYFYASEKIYCLKTVISSSLNNNQILYTISEETLWQKSIESIKTKSQLFDFNNQKPIEIRSSNEKFLPGDVSMMIAYNKINYEHLIISDLLSYTNANTISLSQEIPYEIISYLDSTIESLSVDNHSIIHLKFHHQDEILIHNVLDLQNYLSSGTIKGITIFLQAKYILKNGGYLLIDEIENHFNKEIVTTLLHFFMNKKINTKGATLIYTTHYPELLDLYDRNDTIYITQNTNGIIVHNLSELLNRNDIKKSDAYQSGMIGQTVPQYNRYIKLKKLLQSNSNE